MSFYFTFLSCRNAGGDIDTQTENGSGTDQWRSNLGVSTHSGDSSYREERGGKRPQGESLENVSFFPQLQSLEKEQCLCGPISLSQLIELALIPVQ